MVLLYGSIYERAFSLVGRPLRLFRGYTSHRDKNLWVVVSVHGNGFYGNTKYFFSYLYEKGENVYLLTTEKNPITEELNSITYGRVVYWGEKKAKSLLLSAGVVVSDRTDWMFEGRGDLSRGAFTVQLWHGIGLKLLERCYYRKQGLKGRILYYIGFLEGRWYPYELFISTSDFYTKTWFYPCFFARRFLPLGYPRNDIFFNHKLEALQQVGSDIEALHYIHNAIHSGFKVITYAPTYRRDFSNAFNKGLLSISEINKFASKNNILFVVKLHPWEAKHTRMLNNRYEHVVVYGGEYDIQPLLMNTDILITDYSSVYFDFLLTDKPIIFFPYDKATKDFSFPYERFTPGEKVYDWKSLKQAISYHLYGKDIYRKERKKLKDLVFLHQDGYSRQRIWREIRGHIR